MLSVDEQGYPLFYQINNIFNIDNKWYLGRHIFYIKKCVEEMYAYIVEKLEYTILEPHELLDIHKHRIFIKNNTYYAFTLFKVEENRINY